MVVVAGICARLGVWQLHRYEQREGEMAARRALHEAPPVSDLRLDSTELEYRRATLKGTFRPEADVVAGGIPYGRNGYAVVATLDLDGGGSVMVLRGWIPTEGWTAHRRQSATPVVVSGVLRQIEGAVQVEAIEREGEPLWPLETESFLGGFTRGVRIPWHSLRQHNHPVAEVYLMEGEELADAEDRNPRELPATGYAITKRTFHHIEYAIQWFVFALIAVGIWGLLGVRRARGLAKS